jgi:hypothetical protein
MVLVGVAATGHAFACVEIEPFRLLAAVDGGSSGAALVWVAGAAFDGGSLALVWVPGVLTAGALVTGALTTDDLDSLLTFAGAFAATLSAFA